MKPRNVAILLLVDEENKLLLQQRTVDEHGVSRWGIFGGKIEEGETPEVAMRREIAEELEYTPQDPKLLLTQIFEYKSNVGSGEKHAFIERYDSSQPLKQHEGKGLGWFVPEEISSLPIISHDLPVYEAAAKFIRENY